MDVFGKKESEFRYLLTNLASLWHLLRCKILSASMQMSDSLRPCKVEKDLRQLAAYLTIGLLNRWLN